MRSLGGQEEGLTHGDKTIKVAFPWEVIGTLSDFWGKDKFADRVVDAFETRNVQDLAVILAAGCEPRMTPKEVMAWSPPVVPTVRYLQREWTRHWLGEKHLQMIMDAERRSERDTSEENPSKPHLIKKAWEWLRTRFKRPSSQASAGEISGASAR